MRFSGHEHHHRYHQHQQHAYGQSRIQDYVQPSQPFYNYNQPYEQQFSYNSSQHYINSYNPPQRVPIPSELAHTVGPGYTYMQNRQTPFRLGFVENQQHSSLGWGFSVADSMNLLALAAAAAIAAPSLLTQRATNSSIGQSSYIGVGGRGSISFRGARQGQFNHSRPPLYHGRGRGWGDSGRQIPPHASRPTNSHVASAPAATSVVQSAPSVPGPKPLPTLAQVAAAPLQPPPQKGRCEICNIQCSGPNLEKHMSGKRHKKKLCAQGELERLKAADGQQSEQMPTSQSNSAVHPERIQELEKEGCLAENIISEATVDNRQGEIVLQKDTGNNLEVPTEESEGEPRDNSVAWDLGSKLKIGGRGGKYMKSDDGSRWPVEFPQPAQAPFICELCNVTCDSEIVFDAHLTGKKHKSNLKRVHVPGRQASRRARGLQALYPPDTNALANLIDSLVERGISDPQILLAQLVIKSALSQTQEPGISPPSSPLATQIQVSTSVAGSGSEPASTCLADTSVRGYGTCIE